MLALGSQSLCAEDGDIHMSGHPSLIIVQIYQWHHLAPLQRGPACATAVVNLLSGVFYQSIRRSSPFTLCWSFRAAQKKPSAENVQSRPSLRGFIRGHFPDNRLGFSSTSSFAYYHDSINANPVKWAACSNHPCSAHVASVSLQSTDLPSVYGPPSSTGPQTTREMPQN